MRTGLTRYCAGEACLDPPSLASDDQGVRLGLLQATPSPSTGIKGAVSRPAENPMVVL